MHYSGIRGIIEPMKPTPWYTILLCTVVGLTPVLLGVLRAFGKF